MKLAVPTREGVVDEHFGHCDHYTIYEIEGDSLGQASRLDSPQGCGCKSNIANVLADMGVTVMLAGNIGQGAVNVLSQNGIQVIRGCRGPVFELASAYLAGKVEDQPILCDHHDCGNH